MGMHSAELTLALGSIHFTPKPISELLCGTSQKPSSIDCYLETLEHELRKIDGFKPELPLSTSLLTDAIEKLTKEIRMQREVEPVAEEWMELMGNSDEKRAEEASSDSSEKRNWMSSAKLWTAGSAATCENCKSRDKTGDGSATKTPSKPCKDRVGAFVPLEGTSERAGLMEQGRLLLKPAGEICSINLDVEGSGKCSDSSSVVTHEQVKPCTKLKQRQQQRRFKQQKKNHRRCWSPELHRRFVDALGLLGGAQATPKHIKELMQVDSLTNDEVKSHLQKYRIHLRKQLDSSSTTANGL